MSRPAALLALAVALGVGGCAGAPSADSLAQPLADGRSAAGSSALALELVADGHTTRPAAATLVSDMLEETESALQDVRGLESGTAGERALAESSAAALTQLADALVHARDAIAHDAGGPALADALAEVRDAGEALRAVVREAGAEEKP